MSERDVEVLLEDILQAMSKIERHCSGMDRDSFLADDKTADAKESNKSGRVRKERAHGKSDLVIF